MPKTFQQVLRISTISGELRSEAVGWGAECGRAASFGAISNPTHLSVGRLPSLKCYTYGTPLHALADGWKLLAPPQVDAGDGTLKPEWDWWFVREVEE